MAATLTGVLTDQQRDEYEVLGITRLPSVLERSATAAIVDRVWAGLGRAQGIQRDDRSTWPSGTVSHLQALRQAGVFDAFTTGEVESLIDDLLGTGQWSAHGSWSPLISFPLPGPWDLPSRMWHLDFPARGRVDHPDAVRLLATVVDLAARAGGTLVVAGSHELVRRMAEQAPETGAGSSNDVRKRLQRRYAFFRALTEAGPDRINRLMDDGDVIDGVTVRVVELTGDAGDLWLMHPWMMHNTSMNTAGSPRIMATHTVYRTGHRFRAPPPRVHAAAET